jgi:Tfp pilus assembly protein FimT
MKNNSGFSLIEVLIVATFTSVTLALAVPGMTNLIYRQRLNNANREIYQAIRSTQAEATRRKETWRISFRQTNAGVEWAKHYVSVPLNQVGWNKIDKNILLDSTNSINWTTNTAYSSVLRTTVWWLQFDNNGNFVDTGGRLSAVTPSYPKITLQPSTNVDNSNFAKRCVIIETVIGAMRTEKDQNCR